MSELHVFNNEAEWIVARDMNDLAALLAENPGCCSDIECFEQEPDDSNHTIWCDASGVPTEPHSSGSSEVTLTNAEWCKRRGRGYLCTTEY